MISLKWFFCFFLNFSFSVWASGGGDISGGGQGVLENGKVELLDLRESGHIENTLPIQRKENIYLDEVKKLAFLNAETQLELSYRLEILSQADLLLATATLKGLHFYSWSFTNDELIPTPRDTVLMKEIVQVAVRKPLQVYIVKKYWDMMSSVHQSALLMHEVLAALQNNNTPEIRNRQLVGEIYKVHHGAQFSDSIKNAIQDLWPNFKYNSLIAAGTDVGVEPFELRCRFVDFRPYLYSAFQSSSFLKQEPLIVKTAYPEFYPFAEVEFGKKSTFLPLSRFSIDSETVRHCQKLNSESGLATFEAYRLQVRNKTTGANHTPKLDVLFEKNQVARIPIYKGRCPDFSKLEFEWMRKLMLCH